jgi:deoxyribose-phosphate aldolase
VEANLGLAKAGAWQQVVDDLAAVRAAAPAPVLLKVIVESAVLTDDELVAACRAAVDAGADYVKTSTGFHPAGGATVEAVARMRATVGASIGVKASGGIRDAATALAMVDAGATRLGCSATRAILDAL